MMVQSCQVGREQGESVPLVLFSFSSFLRASEICKSRLSSIGVEDGRGRKVIQRIEGSCVIKDHHVSQEKLNSILVFARTIPQLSPQHKMSVEPDKVVTLSNCISIHTLPL